jgi:hypothetical protein
LSTDPTLPALELTGERIAEAMARVEKVACRPGDERRLALPYDVASGLDTCTLKGRWRVGHPKGHRGERRRNVWRDLHRGEGRVRRQRD